MNIFIICTVRDASTEYRRKLEKYAEDLENAGHSVHLPHRDTNQNASGLNICQENKNAIIKADEVHIFYNLSSQGTHFDMGMAFMAGKKIKIIENVQYEEGKSYPRMLTEWEMLAPKSI